MLSLRGRCAVITGASGALGRAFALQLAGMGANIVINDIGSSLSGVARAVDAVQTDPSEELLHEICSLGLSKAIINRDNVLNGHAVIDSAIKEFGKVDILINNAGILRDRSFHKMSDDDWFKVIDVHLNGSYSCTKAAWPHMMAHTFGRVVNISSGAGLYGNFGQSSYSAAKMALVGLTKTLAKEGCKHNINVNALVPVAHSRMTETVLPRDILSLIDPKHIAPLAAALCSEESSVSGAVFEAGGGWVSEVRLRRSRGAAMGDAVNAATPEAILGSMATIRDFSTPDDALSYPADPADALKAIMASRGGSSQASSPQDNWVDKAAPAAAAVAVVSTAAKHNVSSSISLKIDDVFEAINSRMKDTQLAKSLGEKIDVRIRFSISTPPGDERWYLLDMGAKKGKYLAECDRDQAAKVSLSMSDDTACQLFRGELSPEFAYMRGLLMIDGGMKHALKVKALLDVAAS